MARKRKTAKPDLPPGAQPATASSAPSSGQPGRASPVPPLRQLAAAIAHDNGPQTQPHNVPAAGTQQPAASDSWNSEPQIQCFPAPRTQQPQQPLRLPASTARNAGAAGQSPPFSPSQYPQQPAAPSIHKSGSQAQPPPSAPPEQSATSSAQDSSPETIPPVFCCASIQPTTPFTTPKDTEDSSAEYQKSLEKYRQECEDQLKANPSPYTEKQIQTMKGNLAYCKWDLVHSKQALEHHLQTHPDHEPDFQHFLTWAVTTSTTPPQRGCDGPYKHIIQVTQDLGYNPTMPTLRNLRLRSRLYAPLPQTLSDYCEIQCGRDYRSPKPQKIQLGNTLVCDKHKTRYFICLYVRNPPGKFGGRDDRAVIQFEGGAGVHDVDALVWFGRTGWGVEGGSFGEVGGINWVRAGVGRGLGVQN